MTTDHVLTAREGAVSIIRMNRPDKKNAITRAMYGAMTEALGRGEADDTVRCHVLFGVPGSFSSGNDMQDFLSFAMSGATGLPEVIGFLEAIAGLKKPIVSGVDGLAIGIGMTVNLHCDLTVATARSHFRTPFVDLALVPEAASSLLVPAIAGHQRAFAMLVLGEGFSASQAKDAGLIWDIVEEDELEPKTLELAHRLAARAPEAVRISKSLMKHQPEAVLERIYAEAKLFGERLQSSEARDAFLAFMARKK
ncbi:MAG: crotonase/enoyl-CoA hydratase family protein [Rhizobiaceae bacterium]